MDINDDAIKYLFKNSKLKNIHINCNEHDLVQLWDYPIKIESLSILFEDDLKYLNKFFKKRGKDLINLEIYMNYQIIESIIEYCPNLESLSLVKEYTKKAVNHILLLPKLEKLKSLIVNIEMNQKKFWRKFIKNCPNLRTLLVNGQHMITLFEDI